MVKAKYLDNNKNFLQIQKMRSPSTVWKNILDHKNLTKNVLFGLKT